MDVSAFALYLILVVLISLGWGVATKWATKSRQLTALASYIMRYSRLGLEPVRAILIWFIYLGVGLLGTIVLCVLFGVNLFSYFGLELKYLAFIPLGIMAQMSFSSLILSVIASLNARSNWFSTLMDIPWIRIVVLMPWYIKLIYPLSSAFFEELFFRGAVFLVLVKNFPQLGIMLSIVIPTVLFMVQQYLNTANRSQGLMMAVGSLSISIVGCLLILHTGSFLPALVCHELYALFYLGFRSPTAPSPGTRARKVPTPSSYTSY